MSYIIKEVHVVYEKNKISEVAVVWQSNDLGWVRASHCTTERCSGYKHLSPDAVLTPELIQKVAGQGMNMPSEKRKLYFPSQKDWER